MAKNKDNKSKVWEVSSAAIKSLKDVKARIQNRLKGNFTHFKTADVDQKALLRAVDLKSQIDFLEGQIKALHDEYKPLRDQILFELPGDKADKVDALIHGVHVKKYTQNRGAGQLIQDKALELAKSKKIATKVTKTIKVVDEDLLMLAVADGIITEEEYVECLTEGTVVEMLKLEKKFEISDISDISDALDINLPAYDKVM